MSSTSNYIIRSFGWSVISKLLDAAIKFVSVPLLLKYFGKSEYGLIALATSVNAYLQLLDMGVNTGAIKYFSEWISKGKLTLLDSVARTSISFYGLIGILNAMLLLSFSFFGLGVFSLTPEQAIIFRGLLIILSVFSILNWGTSVFNQLIIANSEVSYIQKANVVRSLLNLVLIFITIYARLHIAIYFFCFTLVNSAMIVPFYLKARRNNLITSFFPGNDWKNFKNVLKYSSAILLMAIFQMSAVKLRPIILSIFSKEGVALVTDFRVLETITVFVISMGSMSTSIFLPQASRLLTESNTQKIGHFAYNGTKFTSIVCAVLCFPFILCAKEILSIYVGAEYTHLSIWLIVWMITILFFLHNGPIASLVLATGKTKALVFSTSIACVVSLIANALISPWLGVGGAVVGYAIYILIQFSWYYLYFNSNVLNLESMKVFKAFILPTSLGFLSVLVVYLIFNHLLSITNDYFAIIIKCCLWGVIFAALIFGLKVCSVKEILGYLKKSNK